MTLAEEKSGITLLTKCRINYRLFSDWPKNTTGICSGMKYLGVILDTRITFGVQISLVVDRKVLGLWHTNEQCWFKPRGSRYHYVFKPCNIISLQDKKVFCPYSCRWAFELKRINIRKRIITCFETCELNGSEIAILEGQMQNHKAPALRSVRKDGTKIWRWFLLTNISNGRSSFLVHF